MSHEMKIIGGFLEGEERGFRNNMKILECLLDELLKKDIKQMDFYEFNDECKTLVKFLRNVNEAAINVKQLKLLKQARIKEE